MGLLESFAEVDVEMTTIAYCNGVLAADTAMCSGGCMIGSTVKIVRRFDGDMAGAAGDATYNRAFLDWFSAGEEGPAPEAKAESDGFDRGVIFRAKPRKIEVFEPRGPFTIVAPYYAFGSGKAEALGAMFVGADAYDAVRAAIALDPHSGGDITVLRCEVY